MDLFVETILEFVAAMIPVIMTVIIVLIANLKKSKSV
jgi:hypothetical protein